MTTYDLFRRKFLESFDKKKECYQNFFQPSNRLLEHWLERPLTTDEKGIAQRAFHTLIDDGLIYDTNGQGWYTLTDLGKKVFTSGQYTTASQSVAVFLKKYQLHLKIAEVSSKLFADGYYKEAILNALVEVISRVKEVSGYPKDANGRDLDGDPLMQKVFGCDGNNEPLIKLNALADSIDRAEQRGFMYLFKGIVGIRNKKAHLNFIQRDPNKTIEYLALTSLLMRLLEDDFLQDVKREST